LKGRKQDRSYSHQDYLKLYNECSPIEQELLQALAVIQMPCRIDDFTKYITALPRVRSAQVNPAVLEGRLRVLSETPLVLSKDGESFQLRTELTQELFSKLVLAQKIDTFVEIALEQFEHLRLVYHQHLDDEIKENIRGLGSSFLLFALRYALYIRKSSFAECNQWLQVFQELFPDEFNKKHPYLRIFDTPFQEIWFSHFTVEVSAKLHMGLLFQKLARLQDPQRILESLEGIYRSTVGEEINDEIYFFLSIFYRLRGRPSSEWINERDVEPQRLGWSLGVKAFQYLIEGSYENAMANFHRAWREVRQDQGVQQVFMGSILGPFFILTALNQRQNNITNEQVLALASNLLIPMHEQRVTAWGTHLIYPIIKQIIAPYLPNSQSLTPLEPTLSFKDNSSLLWLFEALYGLWHYGEDYSQMLKPLRKIYANAKRAGYQWLEAEVGSLIAHLNPEDLKVFKEAENLHIRIGSKSLTSLHPVRLGWRNLLERLRDVGQTKSQIDSRRGHSQTTRLIWVTQNEPSADEFKFSPHLQHQQKETRGRRYASASQGNWSKSKRIYLKDLYKAHIERQPYLTPQDHRVCAQMIISGEQNRTDWEMFSDRDFKLDPKPALIALAGHSLLFRDTKEKRGVMRKPLALEQEKPVLRVIYPDETHLSLDFQPRIKDMPEIKEDEKVLMIIPREGETYRLIECTAVHKNIAELLDQDIRIPRIEGASLHEVIDQLSQFVSIQSDIGDMEGITEHAIADATPIVLFVETDEGGLKVQIRVQPFDQSDHLMRPGEGGKFITNTIGGRRYSVERNLEEEIQKRQLVIDECIIFGELDYKGGDWELKEREQYLEMLLQINNLNRKLLVEEQSQIELRCPEGKELQVNRPEVGHDSLSLKVQKETTAWFSLEGSLAIDDDFKMNIRDLLAKERIGRFIALGNGEFLALTDEFVSHLDELKESTEVDHSGVRFMTNSATLVKHTLENMGETQLSSDRHWNSILKRLNGVNRLDPPKDLQAELRDYQLEGFRWLSGYAILGTGAGACLADDMGLGKTLQALAVLLSRAEKGPSLVIAPTSVVQNWINESQRFTPSLNVKRFGGSTEQRVQMMLDLKAFDLIICTYGLLKTEVDLIARQNWNIVVLDEAQNIKNHTTQAAKAAVRLKSKFRFVTTGTPIENNLTELWSLFQFLNPHLLKGIRDFKERFLNPIEREDSFLARKKLSQLISPFILRRTKESVLKDLPPLTEITLTVDLSDEERKLYEGVKQEQLDSIENRLANGDNSARMELFALLTRLRQLSCHPRLVFPEIDMPSSKLRMFEEQVTQLITGKHKVLVFSQFVKHLDLIKESLEQLRIKYQYLTGETSTKERQKRVDAFQSGEGDVFLISLKAGGVGLNLTAADYVIHMDPWWNPAVEDQASDRAHRIGQERPVTVYRFVGKDTIEEQIVELHKDKRALADAILEGSSSATFNTKQILGLLTEQASQANSQSSTSIRRRRR
jgi:SNF2 family DNA or RNA helicase